MARLGRFVWGNSATGPDPYRLLLGLVVAAVMIFEDRRQARKMDKFMDGVMDRVEARMRSRRDKGGN
jgi:hypothetical protein